MLRGLPSIQDPKLLVGIGTNDDAAVYRLSADTALVQSVDVFTPIVDDPYIFGRIAAANALSDIYAMGARPILAMSIIGFPVGKLPLPDMVQILKGGIDKAREAGIDIAGGHSFEDQEPKYGLCVTGLVHPGRIYRNNTARPGDVLILTKPLGSGVLAQAIKKGQAAAEEIDKVTEVMVQLNKKASEAMVEVGASACTDITGYGLLGHLCEMLQGTALAARLWTSSIPVLKGVREHIKNGIFPGGAKKNLEFYSPHLKWAEAVEENDRLLLADPQTSGGLLIAVPEKRIKELKEALAEKGVSTRAEVGQIFSGASGGVIEINK